MIILEFELMRLLIGIEIRIKSAYFSFNNLKIDFR